MAEDPILTHAREFTDIEIPTLTRWNELQDADLPDLARRLLDAGLQFEHYTSLLPTKVSDRTDQQLRQQGELRQLWQALLDEASAALGPDKGA